MSSSIKAAILPSADGSYPRGTKVWVYLRHSPGDNQTLESQESEVMAKIMENGWILERPAFKDRGVSGGSSERQGFDMMMYLAKATSRPADVLVIWDYSRFSRNADFAQLYRAELRSRGWQIYSLRDDIPTGPMARLYEVIIDWKNESFLSDVRANTKRGLQFIAEQGCVPCGQVCAGYSTIPKIIGRHKDGTPRNGRRPYIDPEKAPLVIRAFELKSKGAPHKVISAETGLFKPESSAWETFFRNPAYIGEFDFAGQTYPNVYEAIIDKDLFATVQARMPTKLKATKVLSTHPRRRGSTFFLANVAVCAHCGSPLEGKSVKSYRYYVCSRHNENTTSCADSSLIPANDLEHEVFSTLKNCILKKDYLRGLLDWMFETTDSQTKHLELLIKTLRNELHDAEEAAKKFARNAMKLETLPDYVNEMIQEHNDKVSSLRVKLSEAESVFRINRATYSEEWIDQFLSSAELKLEAVDSFQLRELCQCVFGKITVSETNVVLDVHFPIEPL